MIHVLHLLDDAGLGGVTRGLQDHISRLGDGFRHEVRVVDTHWRLAPKQNADIVVIHFTLNWTKLPFIASLRARRLIVVEHSYTEAYERLRVAHPGRFRAMLKLGYALADRVVAVSRAQATWLANAGVVRPNRLVAIPTALDTSPLANVSPVGPVAGPMRLGAYGRYVPQKGFDVLIEAMRHVDPSVATLELRGLGPDQDALQAAAADLPHVTVGGPVTDLPTFLEKLDAVVIPSRWEAFGLVAAEARAAGRPILVARTDGLVEQTTSRCGLMFPSEDPDAIATAIADLAVGDLPAMGERGRRAIAGALDATIAQWKTLLRGLAPVGRAA